MDASENSEYNDFIEGIDLNKSGRSVSLIKMMTFLTPRAPRADLGALARNSLKKKASYILASSIFLSASWHWVEEKQ